MKEILEENKEEVISEEAINKENLESKDNLDNTSDEEKIIEIINQLRPYLNSDGGDIEYVKYEDNFVYIKLYGACAACAFQDYTIQDNIYEAIKDVVPECKGIINIEL